MITQARLREVLHYDSETGIFVWLKPPKYHPRMRGKAAGHIIGGYLLIRIDGKRYRAHHLAWLYVYGEMPSTPEMDHRDTNPLNNAIRNLRPCSNSQNQANKRRCRDKKLPKGVRYNHGRYTARICFAGKPETIGTFDTPEEAAEAYRERAQQIYGEFARVA